MMIIGGAGNIESYVCIIPKLANVSKNNFPKILPLIINGGRRTKCGAGFKK
jgi:hypothetical protein